MVWKINFVTCRRAIDFVPWPAWKNTRRIRTSAKEKNLQLYFQNVNIVTLEHDGYVSVHGKKIRIQLILQSVRFNMLELPFSLSARSKFEIIRNVIIFTSSVHKLFLKGVFQNYQKTLKINRLCNRLPAGWIILEYYAAIWVWSSSLSMTQSFGSTL